MAAEPKRVGVDRDSVRGATCGETDFPIRGDRNHAVAGSTTGGVAADGVAAASGSFIEIGQNDDRGGLSDALDVKNRVEGVAVQREAGEDKGENDGVMRRPLGVTGGGRRRDGERGRGDSGIELSDDFFRRE